MKRTDIPFVVLLLAFVPACGQQPGKVNATPTTLTGTVDRSRYELAEEPDGAVGVFTAREEVKHDQQVVLIGRIGGSASPWIEGRAAFMLADASAIHDSGHCEAGCTKACCRNNELVGQTALVKIVDEQGQTLGVDARELFGLKEKDMVVVRGRAQRDEAGNMTILANGLFVRK